jgi:hypothetical protein
LALFSTGATEKNGPRPRLALTKRIEGELLMFGMEDYSLVFFIRIFLPFARPSMFWPTLKSVVS